MVGPLMLLKMLHCRHARQKENKSRQSAKDISGFKSNVGITVKIETLGDITHTCRVCLKPGKIPIYSPNGEADLSEALRSIGGINIDADDEYPKHLCQSCHDFLQGAIILRKTAIQSDYKLRYENPLQIKSESGTESNSCNENDKYYDDIKITENDGHLEETDTQELKNESKKEKQQDVYKCKQCDLDFKSYEDLADHRLTDEHENKRHTCPICNKTLTYQSYKNHMALHTNNKMYICDICGKEFVIQTYLNKHRLTHSNDLPVQCSLCPYRGRFKESLRMHMRSHTGEKPYQCTICPLKFVNKSNLSRHMLIHKGDHDFKCEDCGRGFHTKRRLELHFKVDHTGIKDHVCNICGKAFGYRNKLTKHQLKVHKREKFKSGRVPLYLQVEAKAAEQQEI